MTNTRLEQAKKWLWEATELKRKAAKLINEDNQEQLQKKKRAAEEQVCQCGHSRANHSISYDINYTAGCCLLCDCIAFWLQETEISPPKPIPMDVDGGVPRRIRIDLYTPPEKAIAAAREAVESAGAHVWLTDAVVKLNEAQELVADYMEQFVILPNNPKL